MKTSDGRRTVDRIRSSGSRLRFNLREAELFPRLSVIRHSYNQLDSAIPELLRYYPIALVACLESWSRLAIRELVDFGDPYLGNARQLVQRERFDYQILAGLHGRTITIGEVISQYPSISSLEQTIAIMGPLIGKDFREGVSSVHDRWKVEIEKQPKAPIIADIDETFRYVDRTFELRHIFCHEIATAIEVERNEIEKCIDHTTVFLKASDELISQTLFPDAPLTQADINVASHEDYERERKDLDLLVETISEALSGEQKRRFAAANAAWDKFLVSSAEVEGLAYDGGTMQPTVYALAATRFVRDRKIQLENLLAFAEAHG